MHMKKFLEIGVALLCGSTAGAQDYPLKPIRVITSAPGGSSDFVARLIAQGISPALGQQVLIDNRTGATTGGDIVSKSPADGYTLIYWGSTFWTLPLMRKSVPYDPVKDFAPTTMSITEPLMLVVHPSLPAKSTRELIALAKSRPGERRCARNSGPSKRCSMDVANSRTLAVFNRIALSPSARNRPKLVCDKITGLPIAKNSGSFDGSRNALNSSSCPG